MISLLLPNHLISWHLTKRPCCAWTSDSTIKVTPPQECNESGFCLQETMEQVQLVRAWPSEQQIKPLLLVTSTKRGLARATNWGHKKGEDFRKLFVFVWPTSADDPSDNRAEANCLSASPAPARAPFNQPDQTIWCKRESSLRRQEIFASDNKTETYLINQTTKPSTRKWWEMQEFEIQTINMWIRLQTKKWFEPKYIEKKIRAAFPWRMLSETDWAKTVVRKKERSQVFIKILAGTLLLRLGWCKRSPTSCVITPVQNSDFENAGLQF